MAKFTKKSIVKTKYEHGILLILLVKFIQENGVITKSNYKNMKQLMH